MTAAGVVCDAWAMLQGKSSCWLPTQCFKENQAVEDLDNVNQAVEGLDNASWGTNQFECLSHALLGTKKLVA